MVSKAILEKIVAAVRRQTAVNIWRSTMSVIEWFKEIPDKQRHTFLCFDVVEFYPSIVVVVVVEVYLTSHHKQAISPPLIHVDDRRNERGGGQKYGERKGRNK